MQRRFLINFGFLFLINLIIKPSWILADLWVQRETGEDYGIYFTLFNLSFLFNIIIDAGINNFNNKKIAAVQGRLNHYFPNVFGLRIILSLIYLLVLMIAGWSLGFKSNHFLYLFVLGVNQVLLGVILYVRSNLTAIKLFKTDSFISILDRFFMIVLVLMVWLSPQLKITIPIFIITQFLGYFITALIGLIIIYKKLNRFLPRWNWRFNKKMLLTSYPYAVIVIIMSAYSYTDSIMMNQMLTDGDWHNMIYAHSFRLIMAVNNYAYLISIILMPMFAGFIHQKISVAPLVKTSGSLLIFGLITLAVVAFTNADEIIGILYGKYEGVKSYSLTYDANLVLNAKELVFSKEVFQLLIFAIIPMGFNYIYGTYLTAKGEMKTLNFIAFFGLSANVVLNLLLIPSLGAYGAAVASLSTQSFCALLQFIYAYKHLNITPKFTNAFRFLLSVTFVIITSYYFKINLIWWKGAILVFLLSIPLLFVIRVVTIAQVKKVLQQMKNKSKIG